MILEIFYAGRHVYERSGFRLGALYWAANCERSDWGQVEAALERGDMVLVRPPTTGEAALIADRLAVVEQEIAEIQERRDQERNRR